jgi:hypothetical protein
MLGMVKSERVYIKERELNMIRLNPYNLKIPLRGTIGAIKIESPLAKTEMTVYIHGRLFDTAQAKLTPELAKDLKEICKSQFVNNWRGHEVIICSEEGAIRARLP